MEALLQDLDEGLMDMSPAGLLFPKSRKKIIGRAAGPAGKFGSMFLGKAGKMAHQAAKAAKDAGAAD
jgi:hypothetical protein